MNNAYNQYDTATELPAGDSPCSAEEFVDHLSMLGVAVWPAHPGGSEVIRPPRWQKLSSEENDERRGTFKPGMALCANTGGVLVVVDIDTRNGGDIEKVRSKLSELKVGVFAEVITPSGGRHFYVAGHPQLPSVHSNGGPKSLPGYPGLDIQSFGCHVFVPGTQRPKYGGAGYTIVFNHLEKLLLNGDPKGAEALASWVAQCRGDRARKKATNREATDVNFEPGLPWAGGKPDGRQQAYLDKFLKGCVRTVARAQPGGRNEALFVAALKCSSLVAGAGMDRQVVEDRLAKAAEKCGLDDANEITATVGSAFRNGLQRPRAVPDTWSQPLDDAHIGERIADDYLDGKFLHSGGMGWMQFDGCRWKRVSGDTVFEEIRLGVIDFHQREGKAGADAERLQKISRLLSVNRLRALVTVARGYLAVEDERFDVHHDLLNTLNGVVALRDGTLRPHDPGLLLTKVTPVNYRPDAVHQDWQDALDALPPDAVDWLQLRWGQGLTGYPPPDDLLVVLKGSGSNGKTTLVDAIMSAVGGDYAVQVPDRVLLSHNGDHPTELMTLRGARLAFMEEFPELGHLNVKRLKDVVGTGQITGRYICKDTMAWKATHSLFATTNYVPRVDESDHGTWRRLAMVDFPYRFRKGHEELVPPHDRHGDAGLRDRLRTGHRQHEAALAWLVEGAKRWYAHNKGMGELPESVARSTEEWRGSADLLLSYVADRMTLDPNSHVITTELFADFSQWLADNGHKTWTEQKFTGRFTQHPEIVSHGLKKKRVRSTHTGRSRPTGRLDQIPNQYNAWLGLKFTDGWPP